MNGTNPHFRRRNCASLRPKTAPRYPYPSMNAPGSMLRCISRFQCQRFCRSSEHNWLHELDGVRKWRSLLYCLLVFCSAASLAPLPMPHDDVSDDDDTVSRVQRQIREQKRLTAISRFYFWFSFLILFKLLRNWARPPYLTVARSCSARAAACDGMQALESVSSPLTASFRINDLMT